MQEPLENNEEQFDLNTENELKKIKLSLEHGMDLSKSFTDSDTPPEIEGAFLDYVQQWEDQFAQHKTIVIYDLIGRPEYIPVQDLENDQLAAELNRINDLLQSHDVYLDTLCEVEDRELYRFITEELLVQEMDDIRIPGMRHCFTYEEYHPNHPYDIKNRCVEIIEHTFEKQRSDLAPWGLDDEIEVGGNMIAKEALSRKMINFRDSFSALTVHKREVVSVTVQERSAPGEPLTAQAIYDVQYSGTIEGSAETIEAASRFTFDLVCQYEWWVVNKLAMPGIIAS